jgi:chemotaxis protein CheC
VAESPTANSKIMNGLDPQQLETLDDYIRIGAAEASQALSTWLERPVRVSVGRISQTSLETAAEQLGPGDEIACACCMRVQGGLGGHLLLGFDEASGFILCDALLNRSTPSTGWGEWEISSATETANIVGCSFLNSLSRVFPRLALKPGQTERPPDPTWIPSPPVFVRDYAAAIMQFTLMDQASAFETVLVAQTKFTIDEIPIAWRLLLVPDAKILDQLARALT